MARSIASMILVWDSSMGLREAAPVLKTGRLERIVQETPNNCVFATSIGVLSSAVCLIPSNEEERLTIVADELLRLLGERSEACEVGMFSAISCHR